MNKFNEITNTESTTTYIGANTIQTNYNGSNIIERKDMNAWNEISAGIFNKLPERFTFDELKTSIAGLHLNQKNRANNEAIKNILWLADSNYFIKFETNNEISERVIADLYNIVKVAAHLARCPPARGHLPVRMSRQGLGQERLLDLARKLGFGLEPFADNHLFLQALILDGQRGLLGGDGVAGRARLPGCGAEDSGNGGGHPAARAIRRVLRTGTEAGRPGRRDLPSRRTPFQPELDAAAVSGALR